MKKVLKVTGIILGIVVLAGLTGFLTINLNGLPKYEPGNLDYEVIATPERIERGEKLTLMLCANCHRNPETGKLTGTRMLDAPEEFGKIYSANITNDKEHGIGDMTDGELLYLLRTGIKKNGEYAPPYMAKLPNMADEDIDAIIAFLRSDHEIVQSDPTPSIPCEPSFLTKFLCRVAFKPFPMPEERIELPDSLDPIETGRYLAHNLECFSCHSADFKSNNYLHPELSEGYFGGGNKTLNKKGEIVVTPNLTSDPETGMGKMTEEQFIRAVKYGLKEGEPALQYPMFPYSLLTDEEVSAIYKYLQTIPPIKNEVKRSVYAL